MPDITKKKEIKNSVQNWSVKISELFRVACFAQLAQTVFVNLIN